MKTNTARKSTIAAAAKSVAAKAPLAIVPDAKAADVRGLAERSKVWTALENATGTLRTLMIDGLKVCAQHGLTSADEVGKYWTSCNNPGVYAPNFNRGHKAAQVIGIAATLALIDRAAKLEGGAAFDKAKDALAAVMAEGVKREKAGKTGIATGKEAKAIVDEATSKAAALLAKRAAGSNKAPKTPDGVKVDADPLAAAFADVVAAIQKLAKCKAPEGRERAHAEAMKSYRLGNENMALCVKLTAK